MQDVDRSAVVASNGEPINSNRYIALMSYITLRQASPSFSKAVSGYRLGRFAKSHFPSKDSSASNLQTWTFLLAACMTAIINIRKLISVRTLKFCQAVILKPSALQIVGRHVYFASM